MASIAFLRPESNDDLLLHWNARSSSQNSFLKHKSPIFFRFSFFGFSALAGKSSIKELYWAISLRSFEARLLIFCNFAPAFLFAQSQKSHKERECYQLMSC